MGKGYRFIAPVKPGSGLSNRETPIPSGSEFQRALQLPKAEAKHLWAESYERDLVDVITLQTEVANAIAESRGSGYVRSVVVWAPVKGN